jgi:hypothetical protein
MTNGNAALVLTALVLGLTGSTHCIAMCGGIVGALSGGLVTLGRRRSPAKLRMVGYHAGRITSYAVAGAAAGAFGSLAQHLPFVEGAGLGLRILVGLGLVLLGASLARIGSPLAGLERFGAPVWRLLRPLAQDLLGRPSIASAFAIGSLWGFMPCGLVYAALSIALASQSAAIGAMAMVAFGSATLPMLVAMTFVAGRWARALDVVWIRRAAGATVGAFGLFYILVAGSSLFGEASACPSHPAGESVVVCDIAPR